MRLTDSEHRFFIISLVRLKTINNFTTTINPSSESDQLSLQSSQSNTH